MSVDLVTGRLPALPLGGDDLLEGHGDIDLHRVVSSAGGWYAIGLIGKVSAGG